jgi:REP element-mobilizing transposase RayT
MSYVRVWIHAVWGTKSRKPLLLKSVRQDIFDHIRSNGREKDLYIDFVNGHVDHVHCLFNLNADRSISKTLQLIKGECSFWANSCGLVKPKLDWSDEYFAVSVSESLVPKVRAYIANQEEHHRKKSFTEEWQEFMDWYKKHQKG